LKEATLRKSRQLRPGLEITIPVDILSEEFAAALAEVGLQAPQRAFDSGHWVVFFDEEGRIVQEMPDGTKFEIRFLAGMPRESHIEIVREIPTSKK